MKLEYFQKQIDDGNPVVFYYVQYFDLPSNPPNDPSRIDLKSLDVEKITNSWPWIDLVYDDVRSENSLIPYFKVIVP